MNRKTYLLSFFLIFTHILPLQAGGVDPKQLPSQIQKTLLKAPIGDGLNYDVYDFMLAEIMKNQNVSPEKITSVEQQEEESLKEPESYKSYISDISEMQISHILEPFCKVTPGCLSLAIYQNNGLIFGLASSNVNRKIPSPEDFMTPAFLGKDPLKKIGIQKISCHKGACFYMVTWAIYRKDLGGNHVFGVVSLTPLPQKEGQVVGFLRVGYFL